MDAAQEWGGVMLAGAFTACDGTRVPSGSVCGSAAAEAFDPEVTRPAVQAADSTASGSSADAFWARPNMAIATKVPSLTPIQTRNSRRCYARVVVVWTTSLSLDPGAIAVRLGLSATMSR